MEISAIKKLLFDSNIADGEDDLCFKSAVIILFAWTNQTCNKKRIFWATGYTKPEVDKIIDNLWENGIIQDFNLHFESDPNENPLDFMVELTLFSLCGAGEVVRNFKLDRKIKKNDREISESIWPLPNTGMRVRVNDESVWIRPLRLEGTKVYALCMTSKSKYYEEKETFYCDVSSIERIDYKNDKERQSLINEIIAKNEQLQTL